MLRDARYLLAYTLPLTALVALTWRGPWSYATLAYAFGLLPVLDQLLPRARANEDGEESDSRLASRFFDGLLYANLPIFYGLLAYGLWVVTSEPLAAYEVVGLTLSLGIVAGTLGINVAHELGHRPTRAEQVLAKALLTPCLYTHFFVEHNRGHHRRVATPDDPATARLGEPIYRFWLRSVGGSYAAAWRLERERLARADEPAWQWGNEMVRLTAAQLVYLAVVAGVFGVAGLAFAVGVAVVGFLLLESVNYIEHYGLVRRRLASGRYEPVTPAHSWNSEHEMGRIVLYELTRHADHHYKATRPYQTLRYLPESPELPLGYPGSILMALVPPLWFGVMDPRVYRAQAATPASMAAAPTT